MRGSLLLKSRKLWRYLIRASRLVYISSLSTWITGRAVAIGKGTNFSVPGMEVVKYEGGNELGLILKICLQERRIKELNFFFLALEVV